MDPNNLAVNSVINSYLASSDAEDEQLYAALPRTSDDACPDGVDHYQREMKARILTSLSRFSFWYRLSVHDERLGCI